MTHQPALAVLLTLLLAAALTPASGESTPAAVRGRSLDRAAEEAMADLEWMAWDMHLHTDHSSDGGLFHQNEKDQRNQDTFLDQQRDQALRTGMDAVSFTDHRNFGQHYDPGYAIDTASPLFDGQLLVTGEEWGGGRHGTAFGVTNRIDHGETSRVGCGLAEMTLEVAAQDGLLGIAHPKDGGADACRAELAAFPLSHVEALRGGDNVVQESGVPLGGGNGANTRWYQAFTVQGGRAAAVNGSDNHFKQVWAGPSGPGGSAGHVLVADRSKAGLIEGVRAGRTIGGWGAANIRLTTLLDADRDGSFDAITGGWAAPSGDTVVLAVRVEQGVGHTVQIHDDTGAVLAEADVTLPDETIAFELDASSAFYRATASTTSTTQLGLPDPLDYIDTLVLSSTPVWTTPPTSHGRVPSTVSGPTPTLSDAGWAGFADIAQDGRADGTLHAVWQERSQTTYRIVHRRSIDDGATWGPATVLATGAVRTPAVTASGDRVVVAYEDHDPQRYGGQVVWLTSDDGGATFQEGGRVGDNAARPALASGADADHLVWQQQVPADGTWAIHHLRLDGSARASRRVSFAEAHDGGQATYAVPPRRLLHIPASVEPVVTADGDRVAIAWEDNRQDPTPGRSGAPDDWGIFGSVSTDGGASFSADVRWTPRRLRREEPSDPEGVEGNPARQPDLAFGPDGDLHLAFTDTFESLGFTDVWTQASADGGTTWGPTVRVAPAGEWSYHPQLVVGGDHLDVVWQQASDPTWSLVTARSTDRGLTFQSATPLTTGGRYAGWPTVAGESVLFTAEGPDGGFGVHAARR